MIKLIFTSDHEIHGNGEGDPRELIIEPTNRMLNLFDMYGAKLTIMADVAEIVKFKEYKEKNGVDRFHYDALVEQLQRAVKTGHDVQLHVHSSYYNAEYESGCWKQDYSEYDLAHLSYQRLDEIINGGKKFLESVLKPVKQDYECFAFRAANWSMHPSLNIVRALIDNGFTIDSSVFKYGKRNGLVNFDYTLAFSECIPWPASMDNICDHNSRSGLFEFPIYSENRLIWSFLSINRFYRVIIGLMHRLGNKPAAGSDDKGSDVIKKSAISRLLSIAGILFMRHAWKMDFNQCSGHQLIAGLKRAEKKYSHTDFVVPLVLIGHSKLFTKSNEKNLRLFLKYVAENPERYVFGMFDKSNTALSF